MVVAVLVRETTIHEPKAPTEEMILERLEHWRQALHDHDAGLTNRLRSRREITAAMDRWLEELCQLKQLWWTDELRRHS